MTAAPISPLTLAVIRHKLQAVAEEMVETMIRTCFSPILNQNQDFSAVVLDAQGHTLAQAERVPIHMGAMPRAIRAMAGAFKGDLSEGDVLMANDPYWGGSHLPDLTLGRPVFADGVLRLWVALRAHQGDIGGISAGGYSAAATEIWHEGIRIPPVRLVEGGRLRNDVLRLVAANSRKADDIHGDVLAQLSAVAIGAERLAELFLRYGTAEVARCGHAILDGGEAVMRRQISRWTPGTYEGVSHLEAADGALIPITARVTLAEGHATIDLRDCPDQVPSFLNSPVANTVSAVNVAMLYLSDDVQVLNEGSSRAIEVLTRPGSIVDPVLPGAVVACTSLTAAAIIEAVLQAMEVPAPDAAVAGFARRFRFALAGKDRDDRSYIWHFFFNKGGTGASARADGWTNVGGIHNPGGTPAPGIERTEANYPLLIEEYALRPDAGGAGEHRGGPGGIIRLRYEGDGEAVLNAAGEGVAVPPRGMAGGGDGLGHAYSLHRPNGQVVVIGPRDAGVTIRPGDVIECLSAGGGGYGVPGQRTADAAARDLAWGYVSPALSDG